MKHYHVVKPLIPVDVAEKCGISHETFKNAIQGIKMHYIFEAYKDQLYVYEDPVNLIELDISSIFN